MRRHERIRKAGRALAVVRGVIASCVILASSGTILPAAAAASATTSPSDSGSADLEDAGWIWPATPFRMERAYEAPAHRYGSGHRGIDLHPMGSEDVRAPAGGSVAFVGVVAGRGVLTIDHGAGLVTTLEPIDSALTPGEQVQRGELLGTVALGGHAAPGDLHFGVRLRGEYINPLLLLGGVPRAVLLPCC